MNSSATKARLFCSFMNHLPFRGHMLAVMLLGSTPLFAMPQDVQIIRVNLPPLTLASIQEGLIAVEDASYKMGYRNATGQMVVPYQYSGTENFSDGMGIVTQGKKWGAVDKTGTVVIPLQYDHLRAFYRGFSIASMNRKAGLINKRGQVVIPFEYDSFEYAFPEDEQKNAVDTSLFRIGMKVRQNGRELMKYGLMDSEGTVILKPAFDRLHHFTEGFARFRESGKHGYIDTRGRVQIEPIYDEAREFHEGLAAVKKGKKWGFINTAGAVVVDFKYDEIPVNSGLREAGFFNGYAIVSKNTGLPGGPRWGYIDRTGKEITPLQFETAHPFSDGVFSVTLFEDHNRGKSGVLDKNGQPIMPYVDKYIGIFWNGRARIVGRKNNQNAIGYIDPTGKIVVPMTFTDSSDFEGFATVPEYARVSTSYVSETGQMSNPRYFTIDRNGKVVKPYGFESISAFRRGVAMAYDATGQRVIALIVDKSYKEDMTPLPVAANPAFQCRQTTLTREDQSLSTEVCSRKAYRYVRLSDVAKALTGTKAQFDIVADSKGQSLDIRTQKPYQSKGNEPSGSNGKSKEATPLYSQVTVNGVKTSVTGIIIDGAVYVSVASLDQIAKVEVVDSTNAIELRLKSEPGKPTPDAAVNEGVYRIIPIVNTSLAVGISQGSMQNGAGAITWNNIASVKDQEFIIKTVGNQVCLIARHSNKALTVENKQGAVVTQQPYTEAASQLFTLEAGPNGSFAIKTSYGHYVGVSSGSNKRGTKIIVWSKTGNASQLFKLVRMP